MLSDHTARKDELRHALWQALEAANNYRREAQKAEPIMTAIEQLIDDRISDRG